MLESAFNGPTRQTWILPLQAEAHIQQFWENLGKFEPVDLIPATIVANRPTDGSG
jgi:hypothetical protein